MRSTGGILVSVESATRPCPVCGGVMHAQKTLRRHGVTLEHGPFVGRETTRVCAAGCRRHSPSSMRRVADATDCDVVSASLPIADRGIIRPEQMDRRILAAARSRAPRC